MLEEESPLATVGHVGVKRSGESVGDELEVVAVRQGRIVALKPRAGVDLKCRDNYGGQATKASS